MLPFDPIIFPAQRTHKATVIWLHGLGATKQDFAPVIPALGLSDHVKFILPQAPMRPVTWNQGAVIPAWYDIVSVDREAPQDVDGVKQSAEGLRAIIEAERVAGIPSEQIYIVGFSQGGAMTLFTGLTHPEPLGGIVGLSTYLPVDTTVAAERNEANQNLPILMMHGTEDVVVEYAFGKKSQMILREWGYDVAWHEYPIEHGVTEEELAVVAQWLGQHIMAKVAAV